MIYQSSCEVRPLLIWQVWCVRSLPGRMRQAPVKLRYSHLAFNLLIGIKIDLHPRPVGIVEEQLPYDPS